MSKDITQIEKEINKQLTDLETKIEAVISPVICSPPDQAIIIKFNHEPNNGISKKRGRILGYSVLTRPNKVPPE